MRVSLELRSFSGFCVFVLFQNVNETRKLTANFHRLNILLMRVEEKHSNSKTVARKVATVTLAEAKIQASIGNHL